ncbi:two-component sensor histidine kinase [Cellulomonas sp. APG4]|uniref:sensor histidine kinase n=1 Tax=Cellulomonas sp. APG4 TaxID=1538656 RepID=UPI0013797508|nr:two-component sensor histidine kinase [Cellulomonas sp. APG4]
MTQDAVAHQPLTEISARRLGPVRRFFARRPRAMDVLIIVLFLASVWFTLAPGHETPDGVDPRARLVVVGVVVPLVGTVALWWRRSRPLWVTATMTVLGVVSLVLVGSTGGADLGLAFALYAVAAEHRPPVAWAAAGLSMGTFMTVLWFWERELAQMTLTDGGSESVLSPTAARATTVSLLLALMLLGIAIGMSVRNRRLHVTELVARTEELARDRDRQAALARAAERTRIAREMHDVVAHSISVMIALADGAAASVGRAPESARVAIDELGTTGRAALADMRRVLGVLEPGSGAADDAELDADLGGVVERFRTAGLPIRVTGLTLLDAGKVDPGLCLAVKRIVSEALTNALRHAPGTSRVDLVLRRADGLLVVEVTDRGPQLPVTDAGGAGQGLIGMRERVELHGGRVDAGPWETGWRVRAELPWPGTTEEDG